MNEPVDLSKYRVSIWWSEADRRYLAEMPELPGCMADGPTQEAALQMIREVAALWVETANRALIETQRSQPFLTTQRHLMAVADGRESTGGDTEGHKVVFNGIREPCAKSQVVLYRPSFVAMAFDFNSGSRVVLQPSLRTPCRRRR